jgi:High potential iron-sulfur protein
MDVLLGEHPFCVRDDSINDITESNSQEEMSMELSQLESTRRSFIKFTVTGLAAATLAPGAHADTPMVSEADPTAKALHYVEDAANSSVRTDKSADCANCMQYKGMAGAADGPCVIFPGKSVKAKGWCSAWVKKP